MYRLTNRKIQIQAFLACVVLLASGYYLQYVQNIQPCPLCLLQRLVFMALGLVFLIAAIHNPKPFGRLCYSTLSGLLALLGVSLAVRHIWVQQHPESKIQVCVPGYQYVLQNFPWHQIVSFFLASAENCSKIVPVWGISIPIWSLLAFLGFFGISVWLFVRWRDPSF